MDPQAEQKAWRDVKYAKKFLNAFRGVCIVTKTTKHFFIYALVALLVILLGFYFHISRMEWVVLVFSIGFVVVAEALNTAIEIDIDLTSPEYHPYARDTKDVAAGAVLLAAFVALIIGLIVFLPYLLK